MPRRRPSRFARGAQIHRVAPGRKAAKPTLKVGANIKLRRAAQVDLDELGRHAATFAVERATNVMPILTAIQATPKRTLGAPERNLVSGATTATGRGKVSADSELNVLIFPRMPKATKGTRSADVSTGAELKMLIS